MTLECRLVSYDEDSGCLVGEIINVSAEDRILGQDGKIDPAKLRPITFDPVNNTYLVVGEKAGNALTDTPETLASSSIFIPGRPAMYDSWVEQLAVLRDLGQDTEWASMRLTSFSFNPEKTSGLETEDLDKAYETIADSITELRC